MFLCFQTILVNVMIENIEPTPKIYLLALNQLAINLIIIANHFFDILIAFSINYRKIFVVI